MGIFDALQSGDPIANRGLLDFGLSLLSSRGNFGRALGEAGLSGLQGADRFKAQQAAFQRAAINDEILRAQLKAMQDAQAQQATVQELAGRYYRNPQQQALTQGGGPTVANAQAAQTMPGGFDQQGFINELTSKYPLVGLEMQQRFAKQAPQPIKLGKGDRLFDPQSYRQLAENPDDPKAPTLPNAVQEYQFAQSQGYSGSFNDWVKEKARAGAASNSVVNYGSPVPIMLPDGSVGYAQPPNRAGAPPQVMAGPGGKPLVKPPEQKAEKPMTEAQAKAATFKAQMEAAERELSSTPIDPTKLMSQLDIALASTGANIVSSPAAQRARQAQEQWAEAFLRFKTGAASTEAEVKRNVRTFFPQQGDSKEVIAQKSRMRQQAVEDLDLVASGKPPGSQPAKAPQAVKWNDLK